MTASALRRRSRRAPSPTAPTAGRGAPGGTRGTTGGASPSGLATPANVAGGTGPWDGGLNKVGPKDVVDACRNMDQ